MNHWYSGMTTLSIESYLNTIIHCIQQGPYSVLRTWRSHIANTTRVLVPRLNQNVRTFYTFFYKVCLWYTEVDLQTHVVRSICPTVMCNFRKVKLLENVRGTTLHSTLSCNTILCSLKVQHGSRKTFALPLNIFLRHWIFLVFLF